MSATVSGACDRGMTAMLISDNYWAQWQIYTHNDQTRDAFGIAGRIWQARQEPVGKTG